MSNPNDPYSQQRPPEYPNPGGYPQTPPGYPTPPPGSNIPGGYQAPMHPYVSPPYASWLTRVGAFLIDTVIVGIPAGILYALGFIVGSEDMDCVTDSGPGYSSTSCSGGLSGAGVLLVTLGALVALAGGLYLIYLEGKTGQTPGKKFVNIRLVREADGQPLGFGYAFLRRLCHIVDSLPCYIGYFWPIWDAKKQTFADKIMNTIVVRT
ncbi:RDD family protein [Nocardia sp. 2]|uniref:RDD family protein n=1 Tax=Nocardia acididurans TaxID=2802282 RepID=A0ABS1MAN4_9NOCA|nr:RDD family protein [Nocardia acididurans]MBL1077671.1 RDD family protein [Nocardia acididurans]